MPKRLLRSIIEFDKEISPENLVRNFQRLRKAVDVGQFDWGPEDDKIYKYALGFFIQHFEMPSEQTVLDYFQSVNNVEVLDRLKYVASEKPYARAGFVHLLRELQEAQVSVKAIQLLKETHEILMKGIEDKKTGEVKKGFEEAALHFTKRAQEIRIDEHNVQIHGDIRRDGERMREEYATAENDRGRVLGVLSGINEIDESCKGAKKGELWMHAAFPGELKCLAGDAVVLDHNTGRYRTLKELHDAQELPVVTALADEGRGTHELVLATASHLVQNGVREVYDVTLSSGRSVGATANHKFFTPTGWVELQDLKPGAWVATPAKMALDVPRYRRQFTDSEVKVVGYLLGDGCLTDSNLTLTASNDAIREDFIGCLEDMGLREGDADYETPSFKVLLPADRAPSVKISRSSGRGNSPMISPVWWLLDGLGLLGKGAYEKEIPAALWSLPNDQVSLLLGALWSTDGSCHAADHERSDRESPSRRNDISYASVSRKLCGGVQTLLLRLGIQSSVTRVDTTYKGEPYVFYVVRVVTNPSKLLFVDLVKVIGKEEAFARLRERLPLTDDRIFPTAFIPEGMKIRWWGANGERWRYATNTKNRPGARVDTLALFRAPAVDVALSGDLNWEKVDQIELRGPEMTYDLAVPQHHSFVVNDIVTHNTTLAANWCYNAVTRFHKNVVYVSFEMPRDQIRRNIYTLHSSNARFANQGFAPIDYRHIRDGLLSKQEKEFYFDCVIPDFTTNPTYATFEVVTPDREWTMSDVRQQLEMLHKEFEVGLVVLDHGQWIEARKARKNKDYTIELNSVITDAKRLALNFDHNNGIPVMMLFQINRTGKTEADKNDGVYKMNALTYANNAEKTADVITTTYWNTDMRNSGRTKFTNLKNRDNPLFEPFEAHVNMTCRRIMSGQRMTPQAFTNEGHSNYLETMAVEHI